MMTSSGTAGRKFGGHAADVGRRKGYRDGECWVVCQVFHPDAQSTSQLLSDVVAGLSAKGHRVRVLAGYPGLRVGTRLPSQEIWSGVTIQRGGSRAGVKAGIGSRLLTYATYSWFVFRRLLLAPRGRRVFVVTNPPFMPLLVWFASVFRGHRFVVMLQDIYPEGLTAVGRLKRGGLADRLWRWANLRTFLAAERIWVLGRDMARLVEQGYGVRGAKIRYVPHWSVVSVAMPVAAQRTRLWSQLKLEGKFVVQYSGNMGLWHDMETLVLAADNLRGDPSIRFLFIGAGMRREGAKKLAGELKLENIIWLPYQRREDLEDSLACCHLALISQRAGLEGVAVPCKLYGILASARAVAAQVPRSSETALVVEEEECGVVVPPADPHWLADAICSLKMDPARLAIMGRRAFAAYESKYSLGRAVETFDGAWRDWELVDGRTHGG